MAKSWILTVLLLLTITAVARTQYFDLLQGLQQLFQPYQPQRVTQSNDDVTRHATDRQVNKQEQRKKKPAPNQFDYVFGTTTKPRRKTTKTPVGDNRRSHKNRNINTNLNPLNYEITTKSNRYESTTRTTVSNNRGLYTTVSNNRGPYTTTTTENVLKFNLNNRGASSFNTKPITETIDSKKSDKYTVGTTSNTKYNANNRGAADSHFNNRPTTNNNRNINQDNSGTHSNFGNDQNRPDNNEGIVNNRPETGTRNVNVAHLNNWKSDVDSIGNSNNVVRDVNTDFNFGFVTENPNFNRPGTRPGFVNQSPAITNRPVNDNIYFSNSQGFVEPQSPELLVGPDEDAMSSQQKRRYVDLAERMCNRYKALNVKKLVALPPSLVPSQSAVEFDVTSCNPYSIPLIIGGKIVDIKEFPHMALVGWNKVGIAGYAWKCGGSLISDQYVLTAGHCTYQDKDYEAVSGLAQVVQLGSSYLDDPGAQVVKIASIIRHPKYKRSRAYHDVALIKLVKRVTFSEVIKPACIGVSPPAGEKIVATGWGRTEFGGDHSEELRSVSLPIWDMGDCRTVWGPSLKLPNGPTAESHVCAGDRRGEKDTCQGDSGGPAQVQDGCIWRVVAVTSVGKSCAAPGTPALYAVIPKAFVAAQVFGDDEDYGGRGDVTSNRRGVEFYRNR